MTPIPEAQVSYCQKTWLFHGHIGTEYIQEKLLIIVIKGVRSWAPLIGWGPGRKPLIIASGPDVRHGAVLSRLTRCGW